MTTVPQAPAVTSAVLPWTHAIAEMPSSSRHYTQMATLDECEAIATELGLVACHSLTTGYTIRAIGGGRYKLTGTLEAKLTQSCIVTLEPMETQAKIPVEVEFSPNANQPPQPVAEGEDLEVLSLPDLEPIENAGLNVGRVMLEALATGIDLYPKKPEATFAWNDPRGTATEIHPFAALAKLKPKE
jgi:hypothetical protein